MIDWEEEKGKEEENIRRGRWEGLEEYSIR
jgi:hypothetical protein